MARSVYSSTIAALVLAGGKGSRLSPLTDNRPKPAVPFAGSYRLIDVALSNLSHSEIRHVWVVEQYEAGSLNTYLAGGRPWDLDGTRGGLRIMPPEEKKNGDDDGFSQGNGHVLYQQLAGLEEIGADTVVIASADHLYSLDIRPVLAQHYASESDLTIVTTQIEEQPNRYGVVTANKDGKVTDYSYKPEDPATQVVATEVFVFERATLCKVIDDLLSDSDDPSELGDYGETIIPAFVRDHTVHEYRMEGYWRDLGTIDSYFQAHMDLLAGKFALADPAWPIVTNQQTVLPAVVNSDSVTGSMIGPGARVEGTVSESVIGPNVVVEKGASVHRSVINEGVVVPKGAVLNSVIADAGAHVPAEAIGETKPGPGNITVLSAE